MTEETSKLILSWADKYETESFVFSDRYSSHGNGTKNVMNSDMSKERQM